MWCSYITKKNISRKIIIVIIIFGGFSVFIPFYGWWPQNCLDYKIHILLKIKFWYIIIWK